MLTIGDIGYYKIRVVFERPKRLGTGEWSMYFDEIGFYHIKMAKTAQSEDLFKKLLTAEIARHAAS